METTTRATRGASAAVTYLAIVDLFVCKHGVEAGAGAALLLRALRFFLNLKKIRNAVAMLRYGHCLQVLYFTYLAIVDLLFINMVVVPVRAQPRCSEL